MNHFDAVRVALAEVIAVMDRVQKVDPNYHLTKQPSDVMRELSLSLAEIGKMMENKTYTPNLDDKEQIFGAWTAHFLDLLYCIRPHEIEADYVWDVSITKTMVDEPKTVVEHIIYNREVLPRVDGTWHEQVTTRNREVYDLSTNAKISSDVEYPSDYMGKEVELPEEFDGDEDLLVFDDREDYNSNGDYTNNFYE